MSLNIGILESSKIVAPSSSLLLDTYPNAAIAYSLRKLRTAYTGSAIRVRRSNDNAEQDIGFNISNGFDTTSLLSFIGSNSGYVKTWYDQSINGRNAIQTTTTLQPRIVNSGVIDTKSSKPAIIFNGSSYYLLVGYNTNVLCSSGLYTNLYSVSTFEGSQNTIIGSDNGTNYRYVLHPSFSGNYYWDVGSDVLTRLTGTQATVTSLTLLNYYRDAANMAYYRNGALIGSKNNATGVMNFGRIDFGIGARTSGIGTGYYLQGGLSEIIVYPDYVSANRTGIQSNINTYYSIY